MSESAGSYIELVGLHKAMGGREVLRGVDLEVSRGETLVVLGGSGSGKTVMIRHIVGLLHPDRGRVVVDGTDVTEWSDRQFMEVRRKIAFTFQGGALFDSMTVGENVAYGLVQQGLTPSIVAARVRTALERVHLDQGTEEKMPADLSGGMRKRVAIARSIAMEPECVLYDEPTAGLDPVNSYRVSELIRENARTGRMTSVVVTHDIPSAYHVADRIAFLHEGRIGFIGTTDAARRTRFAPLRGFLDAFEAGR